MRQKTGERVSSASAHSPGITAWPKKLINISLLWQLYYHKPAAGEIFWKIEIFTLNLPSLEHSQCWQPTDLSLHWGPNLEGGPGKVLPVYPLTPRPCIYYMISHAHTTTWPLVNRYSAKLMYIHKPRVIYIATLTYVRVKLALVTHPWAHEASIKTPAQLDASSLLI